MKKKFLLAFLLISISFTLAASPSDNLYDLVVPTQYSSLSLGSNYNWRLNEDGVILFDWKFSTPKSVSVALNLEGDYRWYQQTKDTDLDIFAESEIEVSNTGFEFELNTSPSFRSYSLNINNLPAFWGAGLENLDFYSRFPFTSSSSYTKWITLDFKPFGEFGVGRSFSIYTLKRIETIMKHFDITPNEDKILEVANLMYKYDQDINKFSNDKSNLYAEYYNSLASSLGITNKVAALIYLNTSQLYSFNLSRFIGLRSGWYSAVRLVPGAVYDGTTTYFDGAFKILGEYSQFIIKDSLHLHTEGEVVLGLDGNLAKQFYSNITVSGVVTYLPQSYQWWTNGRLTLKLDTQATPLVSMEVEAKVNYLINPNFTLWGRAQFDLGTPTEKLGVYFGGDIRLF